MVIADKADVGTIVPLSGIIETRWKLECRALLRC